MYYTIGLSLVLFTLINCWFSKTETWQSLPDSSVTNALNHFTSNHTTTTTLNTGPTLSKPPSATKLNEVNTNKERVGDARDESGNWGYRVDPFRIRKTYLKRVKDESLSSAHNEVRNPIWFDSNSEKDDVCETVPGKGVEKDSGWKLLQRVVLNGEAPETEDKYTSAKEQTITEDLAKVKTKIRGRQSLNIPRAPRILCVVYTHEGNHHRLRAQIETWGWRCDGFFAASTKTEQSLSSIDLAHVGPEAYENMWQKTRSILAYAHSNFMNKTMDDFDYLYLVGDDLTVLVENLRNYLETLTKEHEAGAPLYIGSQSWAGEGRHLFNGGGGGYLLNRIALQKYMDSAFATCWSTRRVNAEDRMLGFCMKELGIKPVDTADKAHRQRFQIVDPNFVATKNPKKGFWKRQYKLWEKRHGYHWGIDLISTQSVCFHLLKRPVDIKRIHAILYRSCPKNTALGKALSKIDQSVD